MRLRGVTLQMGMASVALAAWIIDGMDITSRLLLLAPEDATIEAARAHICNDIRVAVHAQAPLEFLREVSRNRVDMVVVDDATVDRELLDAAIALLNPGGVLCVLDACGGATPGLDEIQDRVLARGDCLCTLLATPAPLLMAVRTPEDSRPVRRGGRSARQASGRPPVSNLR